MAWVVDGMRHKRDLVAFHGECRPCPSQCPRTCGHILGNHDNFLRELMTAENIDPARFTRWLERVGGYETYLSYGLEGFHSFDNMAAYFREEYAEHLEVLQKAENMIIDGSFAFVHAGKSMTR
ncbi:hypothetical protein [Phyllobacterium lublinensis]|uniref:hypothetical protein n=1 Tax=Phyllobacterium lublinensis TaxID=2875708 RepID=UPI001CCA7146|nr:hypothetical protein [Phyllobacterium sp. 2063]MBZ9655818.1 hypothetical protein [Phyllobacterium sp. 2063]